MGQKTNPIGFRLGVIKTWNSHWFDEKNFATKLQEDLKLRKYIRNRMKNAGISKIQIDRTPKHITITIYTAKPGIVIGRKGLEVDKLKEELQRVTGKDIQLNVNEIKRPELDAYLVAENVAHQLEAKISYRRAMKKAIMAAMRMGAEGIKIICSGRLGGAEMARTEQYKDGRIPLHTLRADIDYARSVATTTYGCIGVKVWICKGEIVGP
ncbi:30S ribosomal protein S3 [bacterium BMS3Abin05]|nr:30S ribosomal protein S3 [bacterium BMS3Abin05]GBE28662.1 30S ribosomal protein S3 [bacterium BMS3Bbin03]HDL78526.1 30S ribosomal protein S3 [Bacteroidota bacterium]HDZ12421.1 30S ribosomal protein S3 [Bacteroidota bacterium]